MIFPNKTEGIPPPLVKSGMILLPPNILAAKGSLSGNHGDVGDMGEAHRFDLNQTSPDLSHSGVTVTKSRSSAQTKTTLSNLHTHPLLTYPVSVFHNVIENDYISVVKLQKHLSKRRY